MVAHLDVGPPRSICRWDSVGEVGRYRGCYRRYRDRYRRYLDRYLAPLALLGSMRLLALVPWTGGNFGRGPLLLFPPVSLFQLSQ